MKYLKSLILLAVLITLQFTLGNKDGVFQSLFFKVRGPLQPSGQVCLAAIDDVSINVVGNWPWSRAKIAALVDSISVCKPSAVFVNFFFRKKKLTYLEKEERETIREDNQALAAAFSRADNVYIPYFFERIQGDTTAAAVQVPPNKVQVSRFLNILHRNEQHDIKSALKLHYPQPELAESAYGLGFNNIAKNNGIKMHLAIQTIRYGSAFYPSIAVQTLRHHLKQKREALVLDINRNIRLGTAHSIRIDINGASMINFFGPAETFEHISALDIMSRGFNRKRLKNKIVIIGITDLNLKRDADVHRTPFAPQLTASEFWATIIENGLSDKVPFIAYSSLPLALFTPLALLVLLTGFTGVSLSRWDFKRQLFFTLLVLSALLLLGFILFLFHRWVSILVPVLYLMGLLVYFTIRRVRSGPGAGRVLHLSGVTADTARFDKTGQLLYINRYRILKEIGAGAMGTVYKAEDPKINRIVAIKTLKAGNTLTDGHECRSRFLREAHAAGNLSHPNIVTIYDYGDTDNLSYIAMEYIEGISLEERINKDGKLPPSETGRIISQIASALTKAHLHGIIHRDVKPSNIMQTPSENLVKIMDFGVAKVVDATITQTGKSLGTPYYMAPEQINGEEIDLRADIFALGVIAYECLTGRRPFTGANFSSLSYAIINRHPEDITNLNPGLPAGLNAVFTRVLAKSREERYASAIDFSKDFENTLRKSSD